MVCRDRALTGVNSGCIVRGMADRENVIAVRVSDEEYALIRAGAAADSRKVADYVRVHMLARAITDTKGKPITA